MDDTLRALNERLEEVEATIRDLAIQRAALKEAIKQARVSADVEQTDRLIALGKRAITQRDLGMSMADIARANGCSRVKLSKAIAMWRAHEGISAASRGRGGPRATR